MEQYQSFTLQWHITHRCNLRCRHCYQDDYTAFESRADMERVLDQFGALREAYRCRGHVNITGGEPLTHPDLFWLLRQARERGLTTGVLTNGTLLGLREAKLLRACGVSYVQISLDGCEKTHEQIRGKGSFQRAVSSIHALQSQGLFTSISFTAQKNNRRELRRLARLCGDLGVDKLWFDRVVIPAAEDSEGLSLNADEYRRLCKTAAALNRRGKVFCGRALQFLPCQNKQVYHCAAGEDLLVVLAGGDVMPCRRLPLVIGNVRDTDLLTLHRDSPVMRALRETPVPQACAACSYAGCCRGGAKCIAFAREGRFDIADPDCPLLH